MLFYRAHEQIRAHNVKDSGEMDCWWLTISPTPRCICVRVNAYKYFVKCFIEADDCGLLSIFGWIIVNILVCLR
jgi:hypothetical protein